ncbi:hypothetical protein NECID01_1680 [Nematocida sp. AWRm77]|nr:hypothetical protein NECID01_1680 [Nematocida sp. AWRm77]
MDTIFQASTEKVIELLKELNSLSQSTSTEAASLQKRQSLVKQIVHEAQKLDRVYSVSTEGFEKENMQVSERIFHVSQAVFKEVEEKEVLLSEARAVAEDSALVLEHSPEEQILAYASMLAQYSKCPLLWTEELPLERSFPAYPTDSLIQQSVLGQAHLPKKEERRKKKAEKPELPSQREEVKEEEFAFDF